MDIDGAKHSEIKLVRVSEGTFCARFLMPKLGFGADGLVSRVLLFRLLCTSRIAVFLKVLQLPRTQWDTWWHLWLEFRPKPFSVFGDQVSPHVHHERTTMCLNA